MKKIELIPSELLPHRPPMLMIDKVLHTDFADTIIVQTTIEKDNIFLQGHFPDYPLLPGIALIEMMFQACGILNRLHLTSKSGEASNNQKIGKAVKVNSAIFFKEVFPGTTLTIKAKKIRNIFKFGEYSAIVFDADQQKVCEAQLTVTI